MEDLIVAVFGFICLFLIYGLDLYLIKREQKKNDNSQQNNRDTDIQDFTEN